MRCQPFSSLSNILVIMFIGTPSLTTLSLPYLLEEILEIVRPVLSSPHMEISDKVEKSLITPISKRLHGYETY